jgi:glycosyltransferase involved in cell wall biosynthesis
MTDKKVLILTPFYPPNTGGAETFAEALAKESSKWYRTTILSFMPLRKNAPASQVMIKGCLEIFRMKWLLRPPQVWAGTSLRNMFLVIPKMALWSFIIIRRRRFKIVHSLGLLSGVVGGLYRGLFTYKHLLTLLAIYDFKNRGKVFKAACRWIFNRCDVIYVEGEGGKKDLECFNLPEEKIRKFNHWVDQEVFSPPSVRMAEPIRVLFVGRPIPEKGKQLLKDAERIINRPDKYIFTYVDDVSYEDLPNFYRMHHVVCVPSMYAEGFSRVVAEAASCGCAVITSDRGSLPEMVKDFGVCVSVEKFADRLRMFLEEDLTAWGKKAHEYAKLNFSPTNALVLLSEYGK